MLFIQLFSLFSCTILASLVDMSTGRLIRAPLTLEDNSLTITPSPTKVRASIKIGKSKGIYIGINPESSGRPLDIQYFSKDAEMDWKHSYVAVALVGDKKEEDLEKIKQELMDFLRTSQASDQRFMATKFRSLLNSKFDKAQLAMLNVPSITLK